MDSATVTHSATAVSMQHTAAADRQEAGRWMDFPTQQQLELTKKRPGSKR
jgi:hypothetical protein